LERGLKPLSNRCLGIIININLTTNYQLLLNCNKVHRACAAPDKRVKQSFPLSNLGAQVFSWGLHPPHILRSTSRLRSILRRYLWGRIGGSPALTKVAFSAYLGSSLPALFFFHSGSRTQVYLGAPAGCPVSPDCRAETDVFGSNRSFKPARGDAVTQAVIGSCHFLALGVTCGLPRVGERRKFLKVQVIRQKYVTAKSSF
jgi:hypothetical protein